MPNRILELTEEDLREDTLIVLTRQIYAAERKQVPLQIEESKAEVAQRITTVLTAWKQEILKIDDLWIVKYYYLVGEAEKKTQRYICDEFGYSLPTIRKRMRTIRQALIAEIETVLG